MTLLMNKLKGNFAFLSKSIIIFKISNDHEKFTCECTCQWLHVMKVSGISDSKEFTMCEPQDTKRRQKKKNYKTFQTHPN